LNLWLSAAPKSPGVADGHGECGHWVSQWASRIACRLLWAEVLRKTRPLLCSFSNELGSIPVLIGPQEDEKNKTWAADPPVAFQKTKAMARPDPRLPLCPAC